MKQEDLYNLYTKQGDLWKLKELLKINFIMRQREDILASIFHDLSQKLSMKVA